MLLDKTKEYDSLLDLWGTVHKIMAPELEGWVLDQLNEGDEESPGVRPVYNQPLQQDPESQIKIRPLQMQFY